MNRASLVVAAVFAGASFGVVGIAQQSAPQAPPMTSVLAGKKFTPPLRGEADVEFVKSPTRREGTTLVTRFLVRNASTAPIPRLRIAETWYDKEGAVVAGGDGVINGLLQPGEVQAIDIRTPVNPRMATSMLQFSHANGTVPKPKAVKQLDLPKPTTPAAAPAAQKK